jgi:alpha-amylase/alpha-mannosidase (GH57 family)
MAHAVFLWHMHQPYYVNPASNTAVMPWVRLHAVKGYLDMVSLIEEFPGLRVSFNLTPVLLLQIEQLAGNRVHDLWMGWSRKPAADLDENERVSTLENFFKIHTYNLVKPYPRYWELFNKRGEVFDREQARREIRYWSVQEFLDLQTWFNLAWCGYSAERLYPELLALKKKGRLFSESEKLRVLDIHGDILRRIIPLYRAAEERGQAELTTTPFFHPILPLVYDSNLAGRCMPARRLPKRFYWPQDAAAQLQLAVEQHKKFFGRSPRGLWPSEGSVAPELIPLMQQAGIQYFCSDEENLFRSLAGGNVQASGSADRLDLFQGWTVEHGGASVQAVFRDKPLSDFIGFMAAKNSAGESAAHLLGHLGNIANALPGGRGIVPLILDGENAWETFPDGGESFLRALYGGVLSAPSLKSATIEEALLANPPIKRIASLHTGSWISADFDIWIGEEEENRAWNLLGEARDFLQTQLEQGLSTAEKLEQAFFEVYAAEGSDWFWWYGPDFSTENDALFDQLFREHLRNVYATCDRLPPAHLEEPITAARVAPLYSKPERPIRRDLTGRRASFFEWMGAGYYVVGSEQGTMYRSERLLKQIYFGNDSVCLYIRLDPQRCKSATIRVEFYGPEPASLEFPLLPYPRVSAYNWSRNLDMVLPCKALVIGEVIELAVPLALLGAEAGVRVRFQVKVIERGGEGEIETECYPERVPFEYDFLRKDHAVEHWIV